MGEKLPDGWRRPREVWRESEHLVDRVGMVSVGSEAWSWAREDLKEGVGWGSWLGANGTEVDRRHPEGPG